MKEDIVMAMDTIKIKKNGHVKMVAHRGVSGLETQNTAAAFIAAGNRSYYGVETDIHKTIDGFYLCHHDGDTRNTCEQKLWIEGSTCADLRRLRLKDIDGRTDRGELMIPTAYEYQKICRRYGKVCVTEFKADFSEEELREIVAVFDGKMDDVCWISFFFDPLLRLKKMYPEAHCQFLTGECTDELIGRLADAGMGLDIDYAALKQEHIAACHAKGVEVNAWTVNDPAAAEELIEWGIDYITTNILE